MKQGFPRVWNADVTKMVIYRKNPHTNYRLSKDDRNPGISTSSLQELDCDIVVFTDERGCFSVTEFA